MNKLTCLSILFLLLLLSVSCKQADVPELEALSIDSVELSKDFAYTDSQIIITVNAVGVDSISTRTFLSDNLTIEKGSNTSFKVTSDEDVYAPVILQAYKGDKQITKTIYVTFYKHGVVDRNTVEGIKVNVDKISKKPASYASKVFKGFKNLAKGIGGRATGIAGMMMATTGTALGSNKSLKSQEGAARRLYNKRKKK